MKLLLLMVKANIHSFSFGSYTCSFREAPLTLTTLAALIPGDLPINVTLIDESVQAFDPNDYLDFDLVAISALTGTCINAYRRADFFRSKKIPVVLGGVHVTILPDEARRHADAVVVGFAEKTWPQLLRDFMNGKMKKRYVAGRDEIHFDNLPIARRDLQANFRYVMKNTVQATRGCKNTCEFCTVPVICKGYHKRPVADVINEIRSLNGNRFVFNDVSITEDRDYAMALFKAMIPLKKKWGGLATFQVSKDREVMKLLQQSGCTYMLVGFESIFQDALQKIYKGFNHVSEYEEGMKVFHDHGILIQGCFVFGFDHDDESVFEKTVEQVNRLKVDIPRYAIYTPYPETLLFKRLENENRILTYDWSLYDTQHVVYRPVKMNPDKLYEGFRWAFRETFKIKSVLPRTIRSGKDFPITFVGNLAYKLYIKKLYQNANQGLALMQSLENAVLP